jgi:glycosyltransferase involved in cell wall biosynthesis
MKKILYLITQSIWGGAQKYVYDLATNLNPQKFEIVVAAGGDGELLKKLKKAKRKTYSLKYLKRSISPYYEIRAFFEILNLLKKEKPDIIHINSSKGTVLAALAGKMIKTKVIYTVHGSVFMASFPWLIRKFWLWIEKIFSRFKDKIITVSEFDRELWLKHKIVPSEKIVTIHNGLGPKDTKTSIQKLELLKILNLKSSTNYKIVGTIAHLYPEKGIEYLIEAAKILNHELRITNYELIFIVIGEGAERKKLEKLIRKYRLENNFFLLGEIKEASRYLETFDIFVLPSVKEGFPYTVLEALAAGTPIIASQIGGVSEIIENKKNGLLIPKEDPQVLAQKIFFLINNPEIAQRLTEKAKESIKNFSLEKMIKKTENIYFQLKT